jgi:hypothetical protein
MMSGVFLGVSFSISKPAQKTKNGCMTRLMT